MENITNPSDQQKYNFAAVQNASDNVENQNQNFSLNGSLEYDFGWSKYLRGLKVKASYSKNISTGKTNTIGTKSMYIALYPVVAVVVTFMLVTRLNTMLIHWDCMS